MLTALVTGASDRVSDIAIALKSAGFDILAAGPLAAEAAPHFDQQSIDCYVHVTEGPGPAGHRPPEPLPWWHYAGVDADLGYADWRDSILCLASLHDAQPV